LSDSSDLGRDVRKFMELPDEEELKNCYRAFRKRTSNAGLATGVCVICVREMERAQGQKHVLSEIPNTRSHLVAHPTHPVHDTWDGLLILHEHVEGEGHRASGWVCHNCMAALSRDRLPKFALANEMWIGQVPHELDILTIPEQILIARHHPRCFVFKLYPRDSEAHLPLDQLQSGMSGNVSLYEMNTDAVVQMLDGQLMPHRGATLASVVAVTFVGCKKVPKNWLKATFRVRRHVLYEALCWLKLNNPIYEDVNISFERLDSLPEDGVPEEIMAIVRHEPDGTLAERERETYVPGTETVDEGTVINSEGVAMQDEEEDDGMDIDGRGQTCDCL
jgi:hypothetical protein